MMTRFRFLPHSAKAGFLPIGDKELQAATIIGEIVAVTLIKNIERLWSTSLGRFKSERVKKTIVAQFAMM